MKDVLRQISVVLTILATIGINVLANALPINGLNTGQISDRFQVYAAMRCPTSQKTPRWRPFGIN
jgi:hypothetical protein